MSQLSVLILAAGKGVRMKSSLPKVMHPVGGVPMIQRVVQTSLSLMPASICVIIGHGGDVVKRHLTSTFPKSPLLFAKQTTLNGSGGAVRQALSWLRKQKGDVVVSCGDAPLLTTATYKKLLGLHKKEKNLATVLTARLPDPAAYGRIVRSFDGSVRAIVEYLDASESERGIDEVNTGTYCFNSQALAAALPRLKNNNAKREYYLTDSLALIGEKGRIGGCLCSDFSETLGINSRADLATAEGALFQRKRKELMAAGVTLIDPQSIFIGENVSVGTDTVIWPQTFILGASRIGSRCHIGPWTHLRDMEIEDQAIIQASFCESSTVRKSARIGPFSRIRPNSDVGPGAHLGNFSEVKNSRLEAGVKANHLSYLGDAKIGKNVNIGAGTITCNYDGTNKFPTHIENHAFIGSNVNLIAPVRIGAHSVIGAGSSIAKNVPPWALALERAPFVLKKNWVKSKDRKRKKK